MLQKALQSTPDIQYRSDLVQDVLASIDLEEEDEELGDGETDNGLSIPEETLPDLVVIFNNRLTQSQMLNLNQSFGKKVIDRDYLILEIFEANAMTREAQLQIELAKSSLATSRVKKEIGKALSEHQGMGFMGKGYAAWVPVKQHLTRRRKKVDQELTKIRSQRARRRKQRFDEFNVSVIGYTNAGKSTLVNSLSKSALSTANQEFTTVATTSRRVVIPRYDESGNWAPETLIFSDTVGFVYDISPELIDAFLSTLEELRFATLLLVVVDAQDAQQPLVLRQKLQTTRDVITYFSAQQVPTLLAFNKIDLVVELPADALAAAEEVFPGAPVVQLSATTKNGFTELFEHLLAVKSKMPGRPKYPPATND
jgi:GTP-binding protein HflX